MKSKPYIFWLCQPAELAELRGKKKSQNKMLFSDQPMKISDHNVPNTIAIIYFSRSTQRLTRLPRKITF